MSDSRYTAKRESGENPGQSCCCIRAVTAHIHCRFSVRRRAVTLLRKSEYLLKAPAITYTQWGYGEVVLFVYHSL